jgi:hypothetical protein
MSKIIHSFRGHNTQKLKKEIFDMKWYWRGNKKLSCITLFLVKTFLVPKVKTEQKQKNASNTKIMTYGTTEVDQRCYHEQNV